MTIIMYFSEQSLIDQRLPFLKMVCLSVIKGSILDWLFLYEMIEMQIQLINPEQSGHIDSNKTLLWFVIFDKNINLI